MAAIQQEIIERIGKLDAEIQKRVLEFVRSLDMPLGIPGEELIARAHQVNFDPADPEEMKRAIEEVMTTQKTEHEQIRREIERRIITLADKIGIHPNDECFDDQAAQEFLTAWRDLVKYHEDYNDCMIDIEVIREHKTWVNIFGGMKYHENSSADCLDRAEEAEAELNYYLGDIIKMVGRWLYPQGR